MIVNYDQLVTNIEDLAPGVRVTEEYRVECSLGETGYKLILVYEVKPNTFSTLTTKVFNGSELILGKTAPFLEAQTLRETKEFICKTLAQDFGALECL